METKSIVAPRSAGRLLNRSADISQELAEAELRPHGIGLAQWVALSALWRCEKLSVTQLANYNFSKPAATSRLIDRMEKQGLCAKVPQENDARSVLVVLTEKGEALRHLDDVHERVNKRMRDQIGVEKFDLLLELLDSISEGFETDQ